MASFLALYRGRSVGTAELVTVTTDERLIAAFADRMLRNPQRTDAEDRALSAVQQGRRRALEFIRSEAERGAS